MLVWTCGSLLATTNGTYTTNTDPPQFAAITEIKTRKKPTEPNTAASDAMVIPPS